MPLQNNALYVCDELLSVITYAHDITVYQFRLNAIAQIISSESTNYVMCVCT